ncbi:hypothetical protein FQR65_LT18681 [Abscondita terminalis]|nr:hypothetical protein FQR65_LT18681 [Abscondita terminalis]
MNVKEMTTENVIKALKSGEIDAGIVSTPYAAADEFFSDFLYNEELLIYSSKKDLNKDGDSFIIPEDIDLENSKDNEKLILDIDDDLESHEIWKFEPVQYNEHEELPNYKKRAGTHILLPDPEYYFVGDKKVEIKYKVSFIDD